MRLISHPVLCNYYVTYRCNASCNFCDIWEKPSPYIKMDNVRDNFEALKRLKVKVIDFTGGEPLLHRDLHKMLRLAKEMGFITTVTTNALLYPKRAEELAGLVDMLHFSLDYSTKEKHDAARNVNCFDFVQESIQIALKLGERPDILMTVFEDNVEEIKKIYHEVSQPNKLVLILNPAFDYADITTKTASFSHHKELRMWGKKKGVYINDAFLLLREKGGNQVADAVCKAASSTVVISPNNELVMPCYHLGIENIPIDRPLDQLYWDDNVVKMREMEGKYPECDGCTVNCYMQPSFAVEMNEFWWRALPSTLKYNFMKGTWKQLLTGHGRKK